MSMTTQDQLDRLTDELAIEISRKRGEPTRVYRVPQAEGPAFCLGRFGAHRLVSAPTPHQLYERGVGFLAALRSE